MNVIKVNISYWLLCRLILFVITVYGVFFPQISNAQIAEEYMLKASWLERISRFIEWPEEAFNSDTSSPFVISVIGNNPFGDILDKTFEDMKIKDRSVQIRIISDISEIPGSHILFVSSSKRSSISDILQYTKNRSIVTVSDTEGFGELGVLINLFIVEKKLKFEINLPAIRESKLSFDPNFLEYARKIRSSGGTK